MEAAGFYKLNEGKRSEMWAIVVRCGNDISVVFENSNAHVGAIAIGCSQPDKSLVHGAAVSSFRVLGHRDDVLARTAASKLSSALAKNVGVTAGVHIDNASREEIDDLIKCCEQLCDMIIADEIHAEKSGV